MKRIQLHLTEAQDRRLRALSRERGLPRADLIRRAIDAFLHAGTGEDALEDLVGAAGPAGRPDLSERHDDALYRLDPLPLPRVAEKDG